MTASPAVELEDIRVVRGRTAILRGVSCRVPSGACTVILGPNGCGKTSLTRVITGHLLITSGRARVLGERIGRTDIRALRRRVAVVHPTTDVASAHVSGAVVDADLSATEAVLTGFFGTVGLYATPCDSQVRLARQALNDVGLAHRRELRFGLLSTGEQRRALMARALVQAPDLLILDEPTAGLDLAGREQVLATIEAILAGGGGSDSTPDDGPPRPVPTVLMITHHVEEVSPRTARVLLMRDGRITAAGRPEDVVTSESLTETFGCRVFLKRSHGRFWVEVLPEARLDLSRRP